MWLYQDADFVGCLAVKGKGAKIRPPDFTKRGAIRSVFDGRYRLTRYFSPKRHNHPTNLEELVRDNDLELFDLKRDPGELQNLAVDPKASADLLLTMNHKLNALIDHEVGVDDGSMLPVDRNVDWQADKLDI